MSHADDIHKVLKEVAPEGNLVTNWIIVMETTDGLSSELHVASTEGMTPWMGYGMLTAAAQIISSGGADGDEDDD